MFDSVPAYLAEASADPLAMPKAVAAVAGTAIAAGVYLWGRLRKLPARLEASATGRVALAPEDRDLGFTIVRTGNDVVRALNDHAEEMRAQRGAPAPAPAHRRTRTRT